MEEALSSEPPPQGVRFAPSPTGRFHIGNLRTAWISRAFARAWDEPWVVRFEDIDLPRSLPGAREDQLQDMAQLGLVPDEIRIQSESRPRHWATFGRAIQEKRVYPCFCSRKEVREALARSGSAPHPVPGVAPPTYSGHCRGLGPAGQSVHGLPSLAWRFAVLEDPSGRADFIVGRSALEIDEEGWPADPAAFAPAYHWACAVDDLDGNYRLLVRAADLAEVLPQHRAIMRWLAVSEGRAFADFPAVFHTSLVTQNDGHRLEKRTRGATLSELRAAGFGIAEVLGRFERSWDPSQLASAAVAQAAGQLGNVGGEAKKTMTLQELGLG